MKNSFWMFFILLMIITILSSVGGGIRFRENFLDEVFDLNDQNDFSFELNDFPKYFPIQEEQPQMKETKSVAQVTNKAGNVKPIIKEENMQKQLNNTEIQKKKVVFQKTSEPTPLSHESQYELIEGFSGDSYAQPL